MANAIYFLLQKLRREPVAQALLDVHRTEYISQDELRAVQAERQLAQLRFALTQVPHYRASFAGFARDIKQAKSWEDTNAVVEELPIIEKGTIVGRNSDFHAANWERLSTYPDKTSGSSGSPLVFPCDKLAWAYRHALMFRCMESFGVGIGEPYALFFGLHWSKRSRLNLFFRDAVFNRVRVSAYEIGPAALDSHLRKILEFRPTHFLGYPSAIYDFCVLLRSRGMELKRLGLKAVFVTAEPLRPFQRALIEEVTGSRCVNTYGSAEGGLCAFECPAGSLHVASEAVWLSPRQHGIDSGEVIVTDMLLRAFPLIRYAIGDEIVFRQGVCACGRPHPLIASIEGRSGQPITLPNGKRVNANLPSYIFKNLARFGVIRRYRFVQHSNRSIELFLVVTEHFAARHRSLVERETRAAFGDDVPLQIKFVDDLKPLPNAKHRDFISLPDDESAGGREG